MKNIKRESGWWGGATIKGVCSLLKSHRTSSSYSRSVFFAGDPQMFNYCYYPSVCGSDGRRSFHLKKKKKNSHLHQHEWKRGVRGRLCDMEKVD